MRRSTSRTVSRYWPTLAAILGPELRLQPRDVVANRIEEAGLALQRRSPIGRAAALSEQALEDDARVRLGRKGRGRRRPREVVLIDARVAVVALTDHLEQVHRQLERRQQRLLAELLRRDLIDRRAEVVVRALGPLRFRGAQERGVGRGMRAGVGVLQLQVADDRELIHDRTRATAGWGTAPSAGPRLAASSGGGRSPSACRRSPAGAPDPPPSSRGPSSTEPWRRAAGARRSRRGREGTSGAAMPSW